MINSHHASHSDCTWQLRLLPPFQYCRLLLLWLCGDTPVCPFPCRSRTLHPNELDLGNWVDAGNKKLQPWSALIYKSVKSRACTFIEIHCADGVASHSLKLVQLFAALQQLLGQTLVQLSAALHSLSQNDLFHLRLEFSIQSLFSNYHCTWFNS